MTLSPSTFFGGSSALPTANRKVQPGPTGGIPGNALTFAQNPITGAGQNITFTFSVPIYSLSFFITDIDNGLEGDGQAGAGFSDSVVVSNPPTYTSSVPAGSTVTGAGTAVSPFMNSNQLSYGSNSTGGNMQISLVGPITTFSFQYLCGSIQLGGSQLIHMSNIRFEGACSADSPSASSSTSPSNSPTTSGGSMPGCPSKWVAGAVYVAGSVVSMKDASMNWQILRCKSTAAMPTLDKLCNQAGYEPFSELYGGAWQHAWEVVGPCSGTVAPSTAAPASVGGTKPGCPSKWVVGAVYIAGSLVSMYDGQITQILRCKSTAAMPTLDKLCNQAGYEPFSELYGGAWQHAWEVVGPCSGTIAPTSAP